MLLSPRERRWRRIESRRHHSPTRPAPLPFYPHPTPISGRLLPVVNCPIDSALPTCCLAIFHSTRRHLCAYPEHTLPTNPKKNGNRTNLLQRNKSFPARVRAYSTLGIEGAAGLSEDTPRQIRPCLLPSARQTGRPDDTRWNAQAGSGQTETPRAQRASGAPKSRLALSRNLARPQGSINRARAARAPPRRCRAATGLAR